MPPKKRKEVEVEVEVSIANRQVGEGGRRGEGISEIDREIKKR